MEEDDAEDDATFIVAEGNRRVCALKLLNDPDLAPSSIRSNIESYSKEWSPITKMDVVIITNEERRRHWLMRIHDGAQNGRGRMPWKSEQKTRFTGSGRNVVAQNILDYAEEQGLLSSDERSGKISHMARLVGNPLIRDVLGLKTEDGPEELSRNRSKADFDIVLSEILEETKSKSLGSQANKAKIDSFAHKLQNIDGLSNDRLEKPEFLSSESIEISENEDLAEPTENNHDGDEKDVFPKKPSRPTPPKRSHNLNWSEDIAKSLKALESEKLSELYWSVCSVSAQKHAPLVAVGIWSFLDSLASFAGAVDNKPFVHFWKSGKISELGVAKGDAAKTIVNALDRLSKAGNNTKHDAASAHFDYRQLINDWKVVTPLISTQLNEINNI